MATRSALELATNVMTDWGLVSGGETPSSSDTTMIISRYKNVLEELAEDDLAYWPYDAIPSVIFEPLTQIMALVVGRAFGKQVSFGDLEQGMDLFKRRLRRHAHVPASGLPTRVQNF